MPNFENDCYPIRSRLTDLMTIADKLINSIKKATDGLVYISETDAAIEPVSFNFSGEATPSAILKATGRKKNENIEEKDASQFFDRLTKERDWHTAADKEKTKRFARLRSLLEKELSDIKVFRIGKIRIDIYVLGKTKDGTIAGIKTSAIET